ncbi:hypothetical protein [Bordetella hinzii]|uniref:hypothetical protein n=1 Tax=Bordetella hinzii TaxID=103855 RepID=UPI0039FCF2AB
MSVQSTDRVAGPYPCNGLTTQFPFDFKVFNTGEVVAILSDADGVESTLTLGTDYTVALNDNQDSNPGGTLTTLAIYATGYKITLTSEVPNTQPETLTNQGGFYPKVIEHALDRLVIQIQQLADKLSRTVQAPISGGLSSSEILEQLAEQLPLVSAVYGHLANIDAVATNEADIDTVAASVGAVDTVAGDLGGTWAAGVSYDFGSIAVPSIGNTSPPGGNIVIVANSIDNVDTVAENIGDVSTVSTHLSSLLAVANNIDNVASVAGDLENIDAVADNAANINTVAGANANVNTVASNILDVDTVASNIDDVQAVAGNAANINAVADNADNINAAAANQANINAAVGNADNINAAVANQANINAVVGNADNINAVASNEENINTVVDNLADVQTVAGIAADVSTVAENEAAVAALGNDLTGQPMVIDYGDLSPTSNPAAPAGVLGAVWANAENIAAVAENIAVIIEAANNLPAILAALSGALVPANNLSDLADPAAARANIGLADLGGIA